MAESNDNSSEIAADALALAAQLRDDNRRIVFAESCTAGLVAARLAGVPGVSAHLCGSAVTYREQTKIEWLGVEASTLEQHTAVSAAASEQMAEGAIARTTEADLAVAVTGHLGPQAPADIDGLIFIAARGRREFSPPTERLRLAASSRAARQSEAADRVLQWALRWLQELEKQGAS